MMQPGRSPRYILGLIGRSDARDCHDAAAALLRDGEVLFALEQERLSRRRHAPGESAAQAARTCLEAAGLRLDDVDCVAYGWLESLREPGVVLVPEIVASSELTPVLLPPNVIPYRQAPPVFFIRHHRAHMAASFHASGFAEAAGIVLDGQGEDESISLWHGRSGELIRLRGYGIKSSLGMFYESAAFHAGLGWDAAGKLMGLASYGSPEVPIDLAIDPDNGEIRLPRQIEERLAGEDCDGHTLGELWLDYFRSSCYPFAAGNPEEVMYYQNFAASVQKKLEEIACGLAVYVQRLTGCSQLVLSGGVALNCGMNQAIAGLGLFKELYVFPAATDAGTSVGAALALHYQLNGGRASATNGCPMRHADLGLGFGRERIEAALAAHSLPAEALGDEELTSRAATLLARGGILCWFAGRDEFGPRALGQRSLLADPRRRDNLARLNRIKGREMWRPVAPSVLAEHAASVFDAPVDAALGRFMLTVASVSAEYRRYIPAVVHIDGSARPHLVERNEQPLFWQLIESFWRQTGVPLVCNTSLNIRGEPLVHTPEQAIELFNDRPEIDALVMAPYCVIRTKR